MDITYILFALLVGLVAGFIARAIVPGKDHIGLPLTIALGLVGSLIGAVLFRLIGIGDGENFDLGGLIGAVVGAVLVLLVYNATLGKGRRTGSRV